MELHINARKAGKTTAMLEWWHVTDRAVLLTHSEQEAARLRGEAIKRWPDVYAAGPESLHRRILSFSQWMTQRLRYGMRGEIVGIDNLDLVLQEAIGLGNHLGPMTATPVDVPRPARLHLAPRQLSDEEIELIMMKGKIAQSTCRECKRPMDELGCGFGWCVEKGSWKVEEGDDA